VTHPPFTILRCMADDLVPIDNCNVRHTSSPVIVLEMISWAFFVPAFLPYTCVYKTTIAGVCILFWSMVGYRVQKKSGMHLTFLCHCIFIFVL
jgi:hypothetical protein